MLEDFAGSTVVEVLPTTTTTAPTFEALNRVVILGLRQTVEVMGALREIYDRRLWEDAGYASFAAYCEAAAIATGISFGYKRAMQLIEADRRREGLTMADPKLGDLYQSEGTLRALPSLSDPDFLPVAQAARDEAIARGDDAPTPALVQGVRSDRAALEDLGLRDSQDLQRLMAPWGIFRGHVPLSRKTSRYRYQFSCEHEPHRTGLTKLFPDLRGAAQFYLDWCSSINRSKLKGCPNCRFAQPGDGGEIVCGASQNPVKLPHVWDKRACGLFEPGWVPEAWQVATTLPAPVPAPVSDHSAGMLGRQGAKGSGTDEHGTPPYIWQAPLEEWGRTEYDLDPSTADWAGVPARVRYTREVSGLLNSWDLGSPSFIWCNFPYSENSEWVARFLQYWHQGAIAHGFVLEKTDNRTAWYNDLLRNCTAFCLLARGVAHIAPDGTEANSGFFGSTVFYFGDDLPRFKNAYQGIGTVCQPLPYEC